MTEQTTEAPAVDCTPGDPFAGCTCRAGHVHGDRTTYLAHHCRGAACRQANSDYQHTRCTRKILGRPTTPLIDAGPARVHVRALIDAGMHVRRVAVLAGVPAGVLTGLLYGKRVPGRSGLPSQRILGSSAARLLAVPMPTPAFLEAELTDGAVVDGTGTRRRLQALVAIGWSQTDLAERLDTCAADVGKTIHGRPHPGVQLRTRRRVAALYDQLWNVTPPAGYRSTRARSVAAQYGWQPPAAWDDDTIDRPDLAAADVDVDDLVDEVAVERAIAGADVELTGAERREVARRMLARGRGPTAIGRAIRRSGDATKRLLEQLEAEQLEVDDTEVDDTAAAA